MEPLDTSRAVVFRFVFVSVVIAGCHLAFLVTKYLYFEPVVRAARSVVQPASFWVINSLVALGAWLLGDGFAQSLRPYATPAALGAASYFVAFGVAAGAITLAWSLVDRRPS